MSVLFPGFLFPHITLLGLFSVFGFLFFAIMPFPLSFRGGGIFASVFCIYFCHTHRTHRALRWNDVHICCNDVHIYPHRRTLCASQSAYLQSQKQKQRQKRTLKVVKLLIKLFYLVTIIPTTLSGGIAATNNKYDSVFYLRQHPANSLPRLNIVSAYNNVSAYCFELSGKHVEYQCSLSSPINWLREMNAAFVGLDIYYYNNYNKRNKQDSSHLHCNTKQQWFIFQALNHTNVLPVAGTTIFATCGNFTFLHCSFVLLHPHYNTHLFYLSSFQVAFLVPILSPNQEAISESNSGIHDTINSLAIVQCECKNEELTSLKCGANTNDQEDSNNIQKIFLDIFSSLKFQSREIKAFQLLAAGEYSRLIISFAGFVYLFETSDKHVGVATMTSVGFVSMLPWTTTAASICNKHFFLHCETNCHHILLAINDWYNQKSSHLCRNIEQQWFIFQALNHKRVLPVASIPILDSSDGYGFAPSPISGPVSTSLPSISGSVPSIFYSFVPGGVPHWATSFASSQSAFFHQQFFPSSFSGSMLFCRSFFDTSPSASESGGGTAATETTTKTATKTKTETETENRSNEDDVQLIIVGKSLAPNIFHSHKFFPRWRTSRVVNLSSVHVKWLDNTFSESLPPWFYNNHLIVKAHGVKFSKFLWFSSFCQNIDLDLAKAMDQQVDADQQNACVLQYVYEYKWTASFDIVQIFPLY